MGQPGGEYNPGMGAADNHSQRVRDDYEAARQHRRPMRTSPADEVVNQTWNDEEIAESKESQRSVLLDKIKWQARNGSRQNSDGRQKHQALMNIQLSPIIKSQANQDAEDQHIAQRYG